VRATGEALHAARMGGMLSHQRKHARTQRRSLTIASACRHWSTAGNVNARNNLRIVSPKTHEATQYPPRQIVAFGTSHNLNGANNLRLLSPKTRFTTECATTTKFPRDTNQPRPGRQKEWDADAHGLSRLTRMKKKQLSTQQARRSNASLPSASIRQIREHPRLIRHSLTTSRSSPR